MSTVEDPLADEPDVEPTPEPAEEVVDHHVGPLDRDEDGQYLEVGDSRRTAAEGRLGRKFEELRSGA